MSIYSMGYIDSPLCFTANTAGSTVQLTKTGSPTSVSLEISSNGSSWSDYTIGNTITLANAGDKVYMRNKSETPTRFSTGADAYYNFSMEGSISASGDLSSLLCKNLTTELSSYCYFRLFRLCSQMTTPPKLTSKSLKSNCYNQLFSNCSKITQLAEIETDGLPEKCCYYMYYACAGIKLSSTQTGAYQTGYKLTSSGTTGTDATYYMFRNTGGTYTGNPTANTTYYTSNEVIPVADIPKILVKKEVKEIYYGSSKIKAVYYGSKKIRPAENSVTVDFTTGLHDFVYQGVSSGTTRGGNDSNGLYCTGSANLGAAAWKIPSSIYSKGLLKKVEVYLYSTSTKNGGGLSYGIDTKAFRTWQSIDKIWNSTSQLTYATPSGDKTFTIDFTEKYIGFAGTSYKVTLTDADITAFNSDWSAGRVNVCAMMSPGNTYSYVKGIKFYF